LEIKELPLMRYTKYFNINFGTRTLPAGRAFSRRLYLATAKAKKTHQLNKVTKEMYEDLLMLKYFV
jgi:hypothetical protein